MSVSPAGYAHLTHMLTGLAGGRVIVALEGGYNLTAISNSALACAGVLVGARPPRIDMMSPCLSGVESISRAVGHLSPYWICMGKELRVEIARRRKEARHRAAGGGSQPSGSGSGAGDAEAGGSTSSARTQAPPPGLPPSSSSTNSAVEAARVAPVVTVPATPAAPAAPVAAVAVASGSGGSGGDSVDVGRLASKVNRLESIIGTLVNEVNALKGQTSGV